LSAYSYFNTPGIVLNPRIAFNGNALIGIANTNMAVVPGVLCNIQGATKEIVLGTMIRYTLTKESKATGFVKGSALSLGAYYRSLDAIIAAMMLEYGPFGIGISYDLNCSGLTTATSFRGGGEVSIRYSLGQTPSFLK